MTSYGRVARLTALALATGTLVAAGAGTASASSTGSTALAGVTSGSVLTIEINLPAALPDIPNLGHHIVQSFALSDGSVANGAAPTAVGHAALGKGTITDLVSKNIPVDLFPEVTSNLAHPDAQTKGIDLSNQQAGLTLQVLPTTSKVSDPNSSTSTDLSSSSTALDRIKLDVPGVGAALPDALKPVSDALNTVVGTVQAPAGQVTDAVSQAVDTINGALKSTPAGPTTSGALTQAKQTLTNTLTGLQNLPQSIAAANTTLVDIAQLTSNQSVDHVGSVVSASSTNALTNISLLGGLITVDALKSGVTAAVDTAAHKATVTYLPESNQIVKVHVRGVADLILDSTGVHLAGLPSALPTGTVTDAVDGAVAKLLDATQLLGIKVGSGQNAAPMYGADGTGAAGSASGAYLMINPSALGLPDATPLLKLSFVNSAASVSAKAQAIVPPVLLKTTPASALTGTTEAPIMAHTGASFALTAPLAMALLGLALVARRRRLLTD